MPDSAGGAAVRFSQKTDKQVEGLLLLLGARRAVDELYRSGFRLDGAFRDAQLMTRLSC